MGIYIHGMDMPENDELLCISIYPGGNVTIDMDLTCKQIATAVPVPPHGRLIDAGSLYNTLDNRFTEFLHAKRHQKAQSYEIGYWVAMDNAKSALTNAPTIIPAEEGEL